MAETNKEMDAIYHLLEIEKNASSIVNEALKKREDKLAEVKKINARLEEIMQKIFILQAREILTDEEKAEKSAYRGDVPDQQRIDDVIEYLFFIVGALEMGQEMDRVVDGYAQNDGGHPDGDDGNGILDKRKDSQRKQRPEGDRHQNHQDAAEIPVIVVQKGNDEQKRQSDGNETVFLNLSGIGQRHLRGPEAGNVYFSALLFGHLLHGLVN